MVTKSQKQIVVDSSKKGMKHTQDSILSAFRSLFGRIHNVIICFQDLLSFIQYHSGLQSRELGQAPM